jgi:hypothetical protein
MQSLYKKNKWVFALLGVGSYYLGTFIGGIILGVLSELDIIGPVDSMPSVVIGLLALPSGALTCWGFYKILEKSWSKAIMVEQSEVLDSDFFRENT